jgi:hypothetical protein
LKFQQLQHRVSRAEALIEGRRQQTVEQADALIRHWKQGWTPWRIVAVGLGLGFLAGHARPARAMGASKWLRAVSTASGMFTSLQAAVAAWQADQAATKAGDAADSAQDAAGATAQTAAAVQQAAGFTDQDTARAARHAATARAAGMATADAGGHGPARQVPSPENAWAGPGGTGTRAGYPPRPAEAATDVSER